MANIGYVRVSTTEQNTARQEVIMQELGVEKLFIDKISGKTKDRPELQAMLEYVREGDTVHVESISRLSRSGRDFYEIMDKLTGKGVIFKSKKENFDTSTPIGRFALSMFVSVSQLERETLLERQAEGIAIAKAEGKYKGGKRKAYDKELFADVYKRQKNGEITGRYAAKLLGLEERTYLRRKKEYEIELGIKKAGD